MPEFSRTVKINILLCMYHYMIVWLICLLYCSYLKDLLPNEIDDVENIKSTKFYVGYKYKIHEFTKPRKLMLMKKITFTVSKYNYRQHSLNICNTMHKNNEIDVRQWYCWSPTCTLCLVSNFKSFLQRILKCRVTWLSIFHNSYLIIY